MRNYLKKNIIGIIKRMYESHDNARKFIEKKVPVNAKKALTECRTAAQRISEETAKSEGENCSAVVSFNEYCAGVDEALANIFKETNGNKLRKSLDKLLLKAENSVKNDIKTKLEVVFMPYKASMWDSLESIWRAASNDPDCDAYVVPIPYYDRSSDFSLGEFHYEGNDYPEYVPVTHYDEYDLAARRPDIIYIHNPYDEANTVTSADTRFYSSELKKYTDMLVYVPYFVVSGSLPDHFAALPGCACADKVFVQSEEVRNLYIRYFKEAYGDKFGDPKEKFIAAGSPKFDSVVNSRYEKSGLPSEWQEKIGDRKVILYNTSISSILKGNAEYLKKLDSVLKYFEEHKDSIALWWRPHPLSSSTYDSMRHDLLDEYVKTVERYKEADFGIYDDTPDVHRAIALSDAYYGDRSSLVAMYQLTGKPVLLQNTDVQSYENKKVPLMFEDLYDDGEYLWFSSFYFNGLFRMKKDTFEPEYMGSFPDEEKSGERLYTGITHHNDKLYFSPLAAEQIAVYDMKTGGFEKIDPGCEEKPLMEGVLYYNNIEYKDDIIFIPYSVPEILRLNTSSGELMRIAGWADELDGSEFYGYFRKGVIHEDKLYLPSVRTNKMLIVDLKDNSYRTVRIGDVNSKFHSIVCADGKLYICPNEGDALVYDISSGTYEFCNTQQEFMFGVPTEYIDVCICENKLLMFPYHGKEVLEFNGDCISAVKEFSDICDFPPCRIYDGKFIFAETIGSRIYAYAIQNEELVIYDPETGELQRKRICLPFDKYKNIANPEWSKFTACTYIGDMADLYNYIENEDGGDISELVSFFEDGTEEDEYGKTIEFRSGIRKKTLSNPDGTAGEKIHEYVKTEVAK